MEDDLLLSIIESEVEEENEKLKISKNDRLTLEQIKHFEDKHWYFKYRIKALNRLMTGYIIKKDSKILDIGTGTGTVSKLLENYGECTHIDFDEKTIEYNKKNDLNVSYGELPWKLNLKDNYYDYVVLFNIIEYLDNEKWALEVMKNKLKEDGKIIISTLSDPSYYNENDKFYGIKRRYNLKTIEKTLFSIGLKVEYHTFFENTPIKKQLSDTSNRIFEEETLYWNEISKDNDELYDYFINKELPMLGVKPISSGKQLFLVIRKLTKEERIEQLDKITEKENKSRIIDLIIGKIVKKK